MAGVSSRRHVPLGRPSALKSRRPVAGFAAGAFCLLAVWVSGFFPGTAQCAQDAPPDFILVKNILVAGNAAATDTELDVQKDEVYFFSAGGTVSLQKDNPVASCGPEGLGLRTMQQPLPDQNLGALIGKVRERIDIGEDEQTGEKTQRDVGRFFFIGKSGTVAMPLTGRLLLAVNENVTGDNDGGFAVKIFRKRPAAAGVR